jgi:hypothetical protein
LTVASILLKVPVGANPEQYVEVEVDRTDLSEAIQLTAERHADVATAPYSIASSMDRILPALSTVLTKLRSAEHAPDEIAVKVGLKVGGELGLVFAKGRSEATFEVSMTWRKPTADDGA